MIGRVWHGWTRPEHADAYEELLRSSALPGIHRIAGYQGAYLLRRNTGAEGEFVTITLWDSMDAVRVFAGSDGHGAVIAPGAHELLLRFDESSVHYEAFRCP